MRHVSKICAISAISQAAFAGRVASVGRNSRGSRSLEVIANPSTSAAKMTSAQRFSGMEFRSNHACTVV